MPRAVTSLRAALARVGGALAWPWFTKAKPTAIAPTARDLWHQARIAHADAVARGDKRAVGRARKEAKRWAEADLATTQQSARTA